MTNTDLLDPEPEMSADDQYEQDLHMLYSLGKQILGAHRLPDKLSFRLESLVRGIRGCRVCGHVLGDRHEPACAIGGKDTVEYFDLAPLEAPTSPGDDPEPF